MRESGNGRTLLAAARAALVAAAAGAAEYVNGARVDGAELGEWTHDWDAAAAHVLAALRDAGDWEEVRASAYARLLARLDAARTEFVAALRNLRP